MKRCKNTKQKSHRISKKKPKGCYYPGNINIIQVIELSRQKHHTVRSKKPCKDKCCCTITTKGSRDAHSIPKQHIIAKMAKEIHTGKKE
jgi:hypothetical protein